ncbi:Alpha/Beta hydrolase protein [Aspergillus heterothallicus]
MTQLFKCRKHPKLTPSGLIESTTRSHPIPNATGTLAVYTQQSYSRHAPAAQSQRAIYVVDLDTSRSWPISNTATAYSPKWLAGQSDHLIWLEQLPCGHTRFMIADARLQGPAYVAGELPGQVWDLCTAGVAVEEDVGLYDRLSLAVVGKANPDGTLHSPADDHTHTRDVVWFGCLVRPPGFPNGRYSLLRVINLMTYYNLGPEVSLQASPRNENNEEGVVSRDWCMTSSLITFVAKDSNLPGPDHTASVCYICHIFDWTGFTPHDYHAIAHRGLGGAITSPIADRKGAVAFLSQKRDGYAADKNRIIWINDPDGWRYQEIFASPDGKGGWDLSPSSISFAGDGTLLVLVEEKGQRALYQLNPIPYPHEPTPADLKRVEQTLYSKWSSVVDVSPLGEKESSQILITYDSFIHGNRSMLMTLPSSGGRSTRNLFIDDLRSGLSNDQIEQIWFTGANKRRVHWGTTGSFPNLALLAEQGYIVVAPNITGSIGYGEDFVNGTQHTFAGAPYLDLEAGLAYLEKCSVPYIDTARAVALGHGYGGFLVNWIQGQPLGQKFRALVSCNGVLNIMSYLASDNQHLQSVVQEMGGPPWRGAALDEWMRWDPGMYLGKWGTPQLIIHGALDEVHPVSEAHAVVAVLKARKVEREFLRFEDEGHVVKKGENFAQLYETVLAWLERFTG